MKKFLWINAVFLSLIPYFCHGYYVSGALLQHVDLVGKDKETFSIDVINDEKEEIICDVEYGYIEMNKTGSVILHKETSLHKFPLQGPTFTNPIPSNSRGTLSFTVDRSLAPKNSDCLCMGVLVTKRYKNVKFNETEKINAGLKVVQNYLFQVYAQLNRAKTGKFSVDNLNLADNKITFNIKNCSEQVAEPELTIFLNKKNEPLKEPLKRKMRILPDVTREYEIQIEETGITKAQIFIDDPNFEMVQKEINS